MSKSVNDVLMSYLIRDAKKARYVTAKAEYESDANGMLEAIELATMALENASLIPNVEDDFYWDFLEIKGALECATRKRGKMLAENKK